MSIGGVSLRQLSAGCGKAALWRPLLLAQYCCQGGENNIFVKTQSHTISQLPVSASSGSNEDVIDAWLVTSFPTHPPWFRSQTTLELPSAPSDMPTDQFLPAHRQLSRRTPWAHRAVAIIHVDFSGGRHRPSAVAGCVKLVSTTGWTGSASAFPTIAALA